MLTSNCFQYFNPGKQKTQVQQNKAGTALPLDEGEVVWGAERRRSGLEDLPRGESTRSADSLSWSVWLEGWRKIRCGRQMLLAQSHGASKVRP